MNLKTQDMNEELKIYEPTPLAEDALERMFDEGILAELNENITTLTQAKAMRDFGYSIGLRGAEPFQHLVRIGRRLVLDAHGIILIGRRYFNVKIEVILNAVKLPYLMEDGIVIDTQSDPMKLLSLEEPEFATEFKLEYGFPVPIHKSGTFYPYYGFIEGDDEDTKSHEDYGAPFYVSPSTGKYYKIKDKTGRLVPEPDFKEYAKEIKYAKVQKRIPKYDKNAPQNKGKLESFFREDYVTIVKATSDAGEAYGRYSLNEAINGSTVAHNNSPWITNLPPMLFKQASKIAVKTLHPTVGGAAPNYCREEVEEI